MPNADANSPCSLPQERQLLPAARPLSWVCNYLICMALWSIGRAIFRVASNFFPALRERRALSATMAGPRRRIEPRADAEGGQRPMMRTLRVYLAGALLVAAPLTGTGFAHTPGG